MFKKFSGQGESPYGSNIIDLIKREHLYTRKGSTIGVNPNRRLKSDGENG